MDSEFSGVYCNCGAELTFFESDKEAAEKWNTRPIENELHGRIEELESENKRLREALESILDAAQKDEPCILAIKVVAYTTLKGDEE